MKFGIVTFPGSNSRLRRVSRRRRRARRGGRVPLAQGSRPAGQRRRRSCPAASATATTCAPARSRASARSCSEVVAHAERGGPVHRDLQRIPDRLRGGTAARARCCATRASSSSASRFGCASRRPTRCSPIAVRAGPAIVDADRARRRTLHARTTRRSIDWKARAGGVPLRTGGPGEPMNACNPNGSMRAIAGIVNEARQRARHDAASGARGRSAARLRRRARALRIACWHASRPDEERCMRAFITVLCISALRIGSSARRQPRTLDPA